MGLSDAVLGADRLTWQGTSGTAAGWADGYAERAAEQIARIGADGTLRISSGTSAGVALRVHGPGGSCFLQSGAAADAELRDLADAAGGLAPPAVISALRYELPRLARRARELAGDGSGWGWARTARDLLAAARTAALEAGAAQATARLWRRRRWYAMAGGDMVTGAGRTGQATSMLRLTVTAQGGGGPGSAGGADVPAAPLTLARAAELGRRAAAQAAALATAASPPSGAAAVVFTPDAAALLIHEVVGHALEADTAGAAPLWAGRHAPATCPALTVTDDPRDRWAWEQVTADEEGTPCTLAGLIGAGQVTGVLTDRASARALGLPATGHARRGSYASPPVPRMRHTVAAPGPDSAAGIITGTRSGILVEDIESADAIPGQGRYSLRIRLGRDIAGGTAGRSLTGFTVTGGLSEFRLLDAVGDDPAASVSLCGRQGRWLPVSHSSPTLRFPRLSVRGSATR